MFTDGIAKDICPYCLLVATCGMSLAGQISLVICIYVDIMA